MNPENMPPAPPDEDLDNLIPGPGFEAPKGPKRDPETWIALQKKLSRKKLTAIKCRRNIALILSLDPRWKGRLRWNELWGLVFFDRRPIDDDDETEIALWLDRVYGPGFDWGPREVGTVIRVVAKRDRYHPVREYLDGLTWDGVERIDSMLIDYMGAKDTRLNREFSRRWLVSACARARKPGCKVDTVLILVGKQGAKKSTALEKLAVHPEWFSDSTIDMRSKDGYQSLQGVWIYELGELDSVAKRDATTVKAFLSAKVDKYRKSYGRNDERVPRACVLVGTTNESEFLNDPTGARRFWPVRVKHTDAEGLERARDQLWAEADAAYRDGERWWLDDDQESAAAKSAEAFQVGDTWRDLIAKWTKDKIEPFKVSQVAVEGLEISADKHRPGLSRRIGPILRDLGFEKTQMRGPEGRGWYWYDPEHPPAGLGE